MPMAYGDFASTGTGIISLVSALLRHRKTGKGVHIDQSQYEVNVHVLAGAIMEYMVNGRILEETATALPMLLPMAYIPARERTGGWLSPC